MGWFVGLVLQFVTGGDALTEGILNMSLKEPLQQSRNINGNSRKR